MPEGVEPEPTGRICGAIEAVYCLRGGSERSAYEHEKAGAGGGQSCFAIGARMMDHARQNFFTLARETLGVVFLAVLLEGPSRFCKSLIFSCLLICNIERPFRPWVFGDQRFS
jgi:hypothetical protein